LGAYIPFIIIAGDRHVDENGYPKMGITNWIALGVLGAYLLYALIQEMRELKKSKFIEYVTDFANLFNFLALGIIVWAFI